MKGTSFLIEITDTPLADAAQNALGAAQAAAEFGQSGIVLCQLYRSDGRVLIKGGFVTNAHASKIRDLVSEYADSLREPLNP